MLCPVDNTQLRVAHRDGIEVDYCPKCGGVWLDRGELEKIVARQRQEEAGFDEYGPPKSKRDAADRVPDFDMDIGDAFERRRDDGYRREGDTRRSDDYRRDDDYRRGDDNRRDPRRKRSMFEDLLDIFD